MDLIRLLVKKGFVAQISKNMILLYLFFIKIFTPPLKISILQNIYATTPTKEELKGKRLTQSKTPKAYKTKQAQKIRTIKIDLQD